MVWIYEFMWYVSTLFQPELLQYIFQSSCLEVARRHCSIYLDPALDDRNFPRCCPIFFLDNRTKMALKRKQEPIQETTFQ